MYHPQDPEAQSNYTDGVRVKISERYKPPCRINLASSYSQRLSLNKQIQDNIPRYDFSLEVSVKEKMEEWKTARELQMGEKKERLEKIKELWRIEQEKQSEVVNEDENEVNVVSSKHGNNNTLRMDTGLLQPVKVSSAQYADILTPTPLMNLDPTRIYQCQPLDKSPLNISDFEDDTSSPFDNMELKTLNDFEELAQVLKNDETNLSQKSNIPISIQKTYSNYAPIQMNAPHSQSIPNYIQKESIRSQFSTYDVPSYIQPAAVTSKTNGYFYSNQSVPINCSFVNSHEDINKYYESSPSQFRERIENSSTKSFKSVSDIIKALQSDLKSTRVTDSSRSEQITNMVNHKIASPESKSSKYINCELEDPYNSLPKHLQQLSDNISCMGFPLPRVARACKVIGDDYKKVVEHLLVMSELLDLGFPEREVSPALLKCNNDRDKALDILIL